MFSALRMMMSFNRPVMVTWPGVGDDAEVAGAEVALLVEARRRRASGLA